MPFPRWTTRRTAALVLIIVLPAAAAVQAQSASSLKRSTESLLLDPSRSKSGAAVTRRPPPADDCPALVMVTPPQLPDGTQQQSYLFRLRTRGGTAPITFSLMQQARLPPGLHLTPDGLITGLPGESGTYHVTIGAVDSCPNGARSAARSFVLVVAAAATPQIRMESVAVPPADPPSQGPALAVTDLALAFEGGRKAIVVPQGRKLPTLTARLQLQGRGLVSGYWVTPTKEKLFFQASVQSPAAVLSFPADHPLPSDLPGPHGVRLVLTSPQALPPAATVSYLVVREAAPPQTDVPRQLVVAVDTKAKDRLVADLRDRFGLRLLETHRLAALAATILVFETDEAVPPLAERIATLPGVVLAQPNHVFETLSEAEPKEPLQRVSRQLDLAALHTVCTGRGVTVAVIDTGVDPEHEDLQGNIRTTRNFLPDDPFRGEIHGTAVAGIIAAGRNHIGVLGVAPEAKLLALRACRQVAVANPRGQGTTVSIARAIDAALGYPADIVNMSFGAGSADRLIARLIESGDRRGVLFVAPVGNREDLERPAFPASMEQVIAVGGVREDGNVFPNRALAEAADVAAPCEHLLTTVPGDRYNFLDGTSLSAAVVSGVLALAVEKRKGLRRGDLSFAPGGIRLWVKGLLGIDSPE